MNIFIQLTVAGNDTGPFDLYSDVDGFTSVYGIGISRANLVAGYNAVVPDGTTQIKLQSTGNCTNSVIISVTIVPTTTTSTTTIR